MFVYILDEVLEFDNDPKLTKQIFDVINEILEKRELQFSYLLIDEIPIYKEYYTYFKDNIKNIKKVEIVIQTITGLVSETILTASGYIKNATFLITELADEFYQQPDAKTWTKMSDLLEGIQWIIDTLAKIDSINNLNKIVSNYEIWNKYVQEVSKLNNIIPELEGVVLVKDTVSIGDILLYEIKPVFENMWDQLQFLLPGTGDRCVS